MPGAAADAFHAAVQMGRMEDAAHAFTRHVTEGGPPPLPADVFALGRWLYENGFATDAAVLAHFLTATGMVAGSGFRYWAGGWQYARLNACVVGRTNAGRKGTSFAPVDLLMQSVDQGFWNSQRVGGLSSGEGLIAYVAEKCEKDEEGNLQPVPVEDAGDARLQRFERARRGEAEIELHVRLARDHVVRAGAGLDVGHLPGRRREELVAAVPLGGGELREGGAELVDGVAREVRIGDVALHAFHDELAGERAAAAVLDHVAQLLHAGGLAHDAVIRLLAALAQRLDDLDGAVHRRPLLVGREEDRDRAGMARMRRSNRPPGTS